MKEDLQGSIYVDNSLLRTVARCSTEAFLRHAQGFTIQEDAIAAFCGQVWHEILADHLKGKSVEHCLRKYELMYRGYSDELIPDDRKHRWYRLRYENTNAILHEWLVNHPAGGLPFSVNKNLIEVGFQLPLDDECVCGHPSARHKAKGSEGRCQWRSKCGCTGFVHAFIFYGRLDGLVIAEHDRALYVLDHKTTGRLTQWKIEEYRSDSQMSGYVWAAGQTTGQQIVGVYINAIELSVLPSDPVRKCRDHGVTYSECGPLHMKSDLIVYTRSPEQLEEWRKTALHLARRYRDLLKRFPTMDRLHSVRTQGTFHGACGICNFKDFCGAGRPLEYLDSMLVYSPWKPFAADEKKEEKKA